MNTTHPKAPEVVPPTTTPRTTSGTIYPRAWAYWAVAVTASFAAIETAALRQAPGHGTLTAQLRRRRRVSALCIALFGVWAVHHVGWQGVDT